MHHAFHSAFSGLHQDRSEFGRKLATNKTPKIRGSLWGSEQVPQEEDLSVMLEVYRLHCRKYVIWSAFTEIPIRSPARVWLGKGGSKLIDRDWSWSQAADYFSNSSQTFISRYNSNLCYHRRSRFYSADYAHSPERF